MSPSQSLISQYPWTSTPFIASAPMKGFAYHKLAVEVSRAGGLGFIAPSGSSLGEELSKAKEAFKSSPSLESTSSPSDVLPVGVGFMLWAEDLEVAAKAVREYKPAALWLFAPRNGIDDYAIWTEKLRESSPKSKIWIQTGSVNAAVSLAEKCKPDVIVVQGIDAGGHGLEKGAGIVSLVPETVDALAEKGIRDISIVAAGGIVEGRGVAAALALGAEGVVLGTRFLVSEEVVPPNAVYRKAILQTNDGGQSTVRDKIFDQLRGPNQWPAEYDGRGLVNQSYEDWKNGIGLEEIQRSTKEAEDVGKGFGEDGKSGRVALWAGTGVGLVKELKSAREIVEEVRDGARKATGSLRLRI